MSTILVIGAGGFLGSRVARFLAERPDTTVKAGTPAGGRPAPEGLIKAVADVRDVRTLVAAMEGVDAVVNCATGDRWVTVNGTQAILSAARQAGVPRVVHLSSVVVYGQASGLITEEQPLAPMADDPEAALKAEAEGLCLTAMTEGQSVIVLRLPILFGAECVQWAGLTARRLASRRWGTLGDAGDGVCNAVDPRDVCAAVAAALDAPAGTQGAFNIRGPEPLTWNSFFERYNEALGLPPLLAQNLNGFGLRFLVGSLVRETVSHLPQGSQALGGLMAETPTFRELDFFRLRADYAIDKAHSVLGWTPAIPFEDSLSQAAAWVRAGGLAEMLTKARTQGERAAASAPAPDEIGLPLPPLPDFLSSSRLPAFLTPDGLRRLAIVNRNTSLIRAQGILQDDDRSGTFFYSNQNDILAVVETQNCG
ncbi:NAD-dependent epimerase/dehydratase family protein [Pararhodospirillum photometricum]|uniref:NAD-dependent epimerase/dehydratase family protein n=1 Tax=Pararhodospirillum photometricum TaxID=1084 RepID=UPI000313009C|nr:NAD-dependent epimerase/dehydratase family protein [Pararhodospirillum photometricum]